MVKVVLLLDESGSMASIKNDIIEAVNKFIDKQKIEIEGKNEDTFTLIKFNDIVTQPFIIHDQLMSTVKNIHDYEPSGGTALFDAIGFGIKQYEQEDRVIMVIVTDGEENASQKYKTRQEIQQLISKQKIEKNWTFVYLSTDIDTFAEGNKVGILSQNSCDQIARTHNITKNKKDLGDYIGRQVSEGIFESRKNGNTGGCAFSS